MGVIALPNPASVALHEKFGMERVGLFKGIGVKFGQWIDVGYWQREHGLIWCSRTRSGYVGRRGRRVAPAQDPRPKQAPALQCKRAA